MRADVVGLGLAITLLSTSLAHGQVIIDVSKVTCDQFAQSKIGEPRTTSVWLNGYYHGKNGSTTIDTQRSEAIFDCSKSPRPLLRRSSRRSMPRKAFGPGASLRTAWTHRITDELRA